jgi:hypothetical protein
MEETYPLRDSGPQGPEGNLPKASVNVTFGSSVIAACHSGPEEGVAEVQTGPQGRPWPPLAAPAAPLPPSPACLAAARSGSRLARPTRRAAPRLPRRLEAGLGQQQCALQLRPLREPLRDRPRDGPALGRPRGGLLRHRGLRRRLRHGAV